MENSLDPLSLMKHEAKLQKQQQKQLTTRERIDAVLTGDQPKDELSWEFMIWRKFKDPLRIK